MAAKKLITTFLTSTFALVCFTKIAETAINSGEDFTVCNADLEVKSVVIF